MRDADHTIDPFDSTRGALDGMPGVLSTRPSTIDVMTPLTGASTTFIVQTFRHPVPPKPGAKPAGGEEAPDRYGYTVFIQVVEGDGVKRVAVPPRVSELVAAQRESLAAQARRRAARAAAKTRKELGVVPFAPKGKGGAHG